jgi:hypothetical protein
MMKKLTIILLLVLVSAFLLFSGCKKDKDDDDGGITGIPDITPSNYDWDIYFMDYSSDGRASEYMIWADWLGENSAISEEDTFTISLNGETHEFWGGNYGGEWSFYAMAELEPGTEYSMVFKKNDDTVASKSMRMPYQPDATFPSVFDPASSATMSWEMAGNNNFQVVSLSSEGEGDDDYDDWEKAIDVSARTFTFPANAVESYGPDTQYSMSLAQMNFEKSNRVAFSGFSYAANVYGEGTPAKLEASELHQIAKNLHQQMK